MKRLRFGGLLAVLATAVVALVAATAAPAADRAPATSAGSDGIAINFAISKFVVRSGKLYAVGKTIATMQTTDGSYTQTKPFTARVLRHSGGGIRSTASANRICDVLTLNLGPLHLELLGLIIDLNKVVLTLKADSNGGLLGGLLCGLAGGGGTSALGQLAAQLTQLLQGILFPGGLTAPISTAAPGTAAAAATCTVLDLVLGPLDLNLLGLLVHLDQVHLKITADPTKGLLGSLLCGLAGGVPSTA